MKNTNYTDRIKSSGALLVLAFTTLTVSATNVPNPTAGDVFLGFRSSDPSHSSYLVDIGQASQFINATPGTTITLGSIGSIGADLDANFPGWSTDPSVSWAVFGASANVSPSLYISKGRISPGTQTSPWSALTQGAATVTKTQIEGVIYGSYGYRGSLATLNSSVGTVQAAPRTPVPPLALPAAGDTNPVLLTEAPFPAAGNYAYQVTTSGSSFGSRSQWSNTQYSSIESNFGNGASSAVLDFYWINTSTQNVYFKGTFTISSSGVVTFTAVPGTYSTTNDGHTDAQKIAAGVSIYTANNFPVIQSVQHTTHSGSPAISVQFQTAASRNYVIQYSTDLVNWTTVSTFTSGSPGTLYQFLDTDAGRNGSPKAFYRLNISQ